MTRIAPFWTVRILFIEIPGFRATGLLWLKTERLLIRRENGSKENFMV
jgi:hypothetical protein